MCNLLGSVFKMLTPVKKQTLEAIFELRMTVWLLGTRVVQITADEVTCHWHLSVKRYDFRYCVVHFSVDKTRTWEGQRDWTRRNRNRGRSCLGGPLRSCSQDSSNKRTNGTGSGRTMTLSSLNKANYSNVRAWGHRRWALITRQTALSCPIKWNSWHLTTQQRIARVWRNKYSFVDRMPLSRKSWCHQSHCESRFKMSSSLDMTLWTSLYY